MSTRYIHNLTHTCALTAFLFIVSIIFTSLTSWTVASTGPLWAGKYGFDTTLGWWGFGNYHDPRNIVIPRHDGGFVALSQREDDVGLIDFWVSGLNSEGGTQWQKSYGIVLKDQATDGIISSAFYETPRAVEQTDDNGYIVVGSTYPQYGAYAEEDILLVKFNSTNTVDWVKRYDSGYFDVGYSVEQTVDGGYIVGGTSANDVAMLKVDQNGTLEWSRIYDAGTNTVVAGVRETGGGYIFGGSRYTYGSASFQIWLIKVDPDGDKLWEQTWGTDPTADPSYKGWHDYPRDIEVTADGGYILVGKFHVPLLAVKFGWEGGIPDDTAPSKLKVDWANYYEYEQENPISNLWHEAWSVEQTDDGNFVVAGEARVESGLSRAWVLKLGSANGAVEWSQFYDGRPDGPANGLAQSVRKTDGGGLVVSGFDTWDGGRGMIVLHTNEFGEIDDACGAIDEPPPQTTITPLTYLEDPEARDLSADKLDNPFVEHVPASETFIDVDSEITGLTNEQHCYYAGTVSVDIEKATNGAQADDPNDADVPRIAVGETVTWTYQVANTSEVDLLYTDVQVTDSHPDVTPGLDSASDAGGDMVLSRSETWTYTATQQAMDLDALSLPNGTVVVAGCGDSRNTYQNTGQVEIQGTDASDSDLSHYCNPSNQDPVVDVHQATVTVDEGDPTTNTGSVIDPDGDTVALSASVGSVSNDNDGTWSWSWATADGPADSQTVTVTTTDANGGMATVDFELVVENVAPALELIEVPPDPVAFSDQPVDVSTTFSDPAGALDQHSCTVDYGDGAGAQAATVADSVCSGAYSFGQPGVYSVSVTVTDKDGGVGSGTAADFIVIYDASGGFVTGGGWIDSPEGACQLTQACSGVTGSANFGFVSKYKKDATVPIGQTEFQFQAGDLNFHSDDYQWLVVAGPKAKYKGTGTINGSGNYGFMLSAIDEKLTPSTDVDRFRIKIWDKESGNTIVYDNEMGAEETGNPSTAITKGSIVIHKVKK